LHLASKNQKGNADGGEVVHGVLVGRSKLGFVACLVGLFLWSQEIANVLQLAEGGAFEAPSVKLRLKFIRNRKVSATTNAPLLARCCYKLAFFQFPFLNCLSIQ